MCRGAALETCFRQQIERGIPHRQTLSSALGSVRDVYRDLIWGLRWLLSPAILATMTLVLSNAVSISIRERRTEIAVLKVLAAYLGALLLLGGLALERTRRRLFDRAPVPAPPVPSAGGDRTVPRRLTRAAS